MKRGGTTSHIYHHYHIPLRITPYIHHYLLPAERCQLYTPVLRADVVRGSAKGHHWGLRDIYVHHDLLPAERCQLYTPVLRADVVRVLLRDITEDSEIYMYTMTCFLPRGVSCIPPSSVRMWYGVLLRDITVEIYMYTITCFLPRGVSCIPPSSVRMWYGVLLRDITVEIYMYTITCFLQRGVSCIPPSSVRMWYGGSTKGYHWGLRDIYVHHYLLPAEGSQLYTPVLRADVGGFLLRDITSLRTPRYICTPLPASWRGESAVYPRCMCGCGRVSTKGHHGGLRDTKCIYVHHYLLPAEGSQLYTPGVCADVVGGSTKRHHIHH